MPWGELPRGSKDAEPEGILLVDKDQGVTSHDVVGAVRRLAATRKVGHGGTLDPMATGLLTIGIGRATKLLTYITGEDKDYAATICFGVATTTEDADGEPMSEPAPGLAGSPLAAALDTDAAQFASDIYGLAPGPEAGQGAAEAALASAMSALTGEISQVPSSVSAIKVDGKRAHELARAGEDFELAARKITISRFEITGPLRPGPQIAVDGQTVDTLLLDVEVSCSSGTYIRALARDLGAALGVGAHLTSLRRTRVGSWDVADARTVREHAVVVENDKPLAVLGIDEVCAALLPVVRISDDEAALLARGQFIEMKPLENADRGSFPAAAFDPQGRAVAIVSKRSGKLKPDLQLRNN